MSIDELGAPATLRPIEVASGIIFGFAKRVPLDLGEPRVTPRLALEQSILPALLRPPCYVSFSGGRDSSAILAVATALARREGLPLPIPVTNRFVEAAGSEESTWQERVIDHVRPSDWVRLELHDELDPVGFIAARGLLKHGLLWPFNAHFHVPPLETATGGSLLTGVGGDELFGSSRWHRANLVLAGRTRPRPHDALAVALALSPVPVRRWVLRRRVDVPFGWLTPTGRDELARAVVELEATEPRTYRRQLEWWHSMHATRIGQHSLALLAGDADTEIVHPFTSPAVAAALARALPRTGLLDRASRMQYLLGDLLPEEVYRRRTKAHFDEAFWGASSREQAAHWSGEGIDTELVDAAALRAEWARDRPDSHTFTILQAALLTREKVPLSHTFPTLRAAGT